MENIGYLQKWYNLLLADFTWLMSFGISGFFLAIIILFIIKPDIPKRIKVIILSLLAVFGWFRRQYLSNKYEIDITKASKIINSELGDELLPTECKINWVRETTRESFVKDGKIVVKLSFNEDRNKGYVKAVVAFLQRGLLQNAKFYVSPEIAKSSELVIAKKVIMKTDNNEYLRCFMEEILNPMLENDPQLKDCIQRLNILDKKGYLCKYFCRKF